MILLPFSEKFTSHFILIRGGGKALATDHDHDTLEFDPWSMVKKFDHGHLHPGICPMVNGQTKLVLLWSNFVVKSRVYLFDHGNSNFGHGHGHNGHFSFCG